jgi:hypothetical protein
MSEFDEETGELVALVSFMVQKLARRARGNGE